MNRESIDALLEEGLTCYHRKDYGQALAAFEKSVALAPECAKCLSNLGVVYSALGRYQRSIECYLKAIALAPEYAGSYTNLGNAYNRIGEYEQAVVMHMKAIALNPKAADHHANLGIAYKNLGRFDRAQRSFEKAIKLNPDHVNAHFELSMVLLQVGAYQSGWEHYEWRFKKQEMQGHLKRHKAIFSKPLYVDQELLGKRILIHSEQGYGDSLMMIRYASCLKERGAYVIVSARKGLEKLFSSLDWIDLVLEQSEPLVAFDYQLPMMSLAYRCDTLVSKVNEHMPYLKAPSKRPTLQTDKRVKIGIVWGASNTGGSYAKKVFSLAFFKPLFHHSAMALYSLQIGQDSAILQEEPYREAIVNLADEIDDFNDTAAIIEQLDLVITTDTSVAHLAGGMGKPVWVLLQKTADWRWGVYGEKSMWYPSARLFRQLSWDDWESVFKAVYASLEQAFNLVIERD